MMKRLISLMLALALLLSLAACGSTPAETTEPPTEHIPEPAEILADAIAALEEEPSLRLSVNYSSTASFGSTSITERCDQTFLLTGLGTDSLRAEVTDFTRIGDTSVTTVFAYGDGTVYADVEDCFFKSEATPEEFLSMWQPLALMDPANFGTVTQEADGTMVLTEPTRVEGWLGGSEEFSAITASVSMKDGTISGASYRAEYTHAGMDMQMDITMSVDSRRADTVTLPENPEDYLLVDDAAAPGTIALSLAAFDLATARKANTTFVLVSQAAGMALELNATSALVNGDEVLYDMEQNATYASMDGTETLSSTEHFAAGELTITGTQDGGKEETNTFSVPDGLVLNNAFAKQLDYAPVIASMQEIHSEFVGGLLYIYGTMDEEWCDSEQQYVCSTLFQQPGLLTELSSAYRTEKAEVYMALDPYTMLPTAFGQDYEGVHTFDEGDASVISQGYVSFSYNETDTLNTILEELPEDEMPEELPTPAFYHVTDEEGHEMWLLGTIHIGDNRTAYLPQELYQALENSDALAVEFDLDTFEERMETDETLIETVRGAYLYSDGSMLTDHLEEDVREDALKFLKATGTYSPYTEQYQAWVMSQLSNDCYDGFLGKLSSEKGVDKRLLKLAREQGKKIYDVESGEFQLTMFANQDDDFQQFMLESSMDASLGGYVSGTRELFELWCRGDEAELREKFEEEYELYSMTDDELAEYLRTEEGYETVTDEDLAELKEEMALNTRYTQIMLIDRNAGMLEKAKGYLASGETVFFAVGLAHLLDQDGLVDTLQAAGYTVEKVMFG